MKLVTCRLTCKQGKISDLSQFLAIAWRLGRRSCWINGGLLASAALLHVLVGLVFLGSASQSASQCGSFLSSLPCRLVLCIFLVKEDICFDPSSFVHRAGSLALLQASQASPVGSPIIMCSTNHIWSLLCFPASLPSMWPSSICPRSRRNISVSHATRGPRCRQRGERSCLRRRGYSPQATACNKHGPLLSLSFVLFAD